MNQSLRQRCAIVAVLSMACTTSLFSATRQKLAPQYQEFLKGPPSYLLTKPERQAFLQLKTNDQRDRFIENFWEVRNPAPGSGQNEFKDEFYRRVAFVNAYYGKSDGEEGWRTDRGRTYILFGRPQTSMSWPGNQQLYPVELWFYSNPGISEMPPFFYVIFFERDGISGYHFYSPYLDGPARLIRDSVTKAQAYQYLRGFSPELATASLSLIPGEPPDLVNYSGSMDSAQILNGIEGYSEMPSYVATISARETRLAQVSSHIEYKVARSSLLTFVAYEDGNPWLHWRVEVNDPAQPKTKNGHGKYQIVSRLLSRGRLVYERTDEPAFNVPPAAAELLKKKPFVYEDRIPVEPGSYQLAVTVTNTAANETYEIGKNFSVETASDRPWLSNILIYDGHEPDPRKRPFEFGGVKFSPDEGRYVMSSRGLPILYQIVAPEQRPEELKIEYVVGNLSTQLRKTFEDKVQAAQFDASGSLLTARTLPIQELGPGAYRLAVRVIDPATGKMVAQSTSFNVVSSIDQPKPIVVSPGRSTTPQALAANHYERALCFLAQNRPSKAVEALKASLQYSKNSVVQGLLDHLSQSNLQNNANTYPIDSSIHRITNKEKQP